MRGGFVHAVSVSPSMKARLQEQLPESLSGASRNGLRQLFLGPPPVRDRYEVTRDPARDREILMQRRSAQAVRESLSTRARPRDVFWGLVDVQPVFSQFVVLVSV